jgi:hypothetical protein
LGNIYEGMVDPAPEQCEKWNTKIVESAIKMYQERKPLTTSSATKQCEVIKAAMSEAVPSSAITVSLSYGSP